MIPNKAMETIATVLSTNTWEIAVGKGTTAPWVDNLTLEDEYDRMDATTSLTTTTITNDTVVIEGIFEFAEIVTIGEFGVFDKTSGFILSRWTYSSITTEAGMRLRVALSVQVKR